MTPKREGRRSRPRKQHDIGTGGHVKANITHKQRHYNETEPFLSGLVSPLWQYFDLWHNIFPLTNYGNMELIQ